MMRYHDFRTGLTFGAVVEIMWAEREQSYASTGQYKGSPSRGLVLGKFRAIKLEMYEGMCRAEGIEPDYE